MSTVVAGKMSVEAPVQNRNLNLPLLFRLPRAESLLDGVLRSVDSRRIEQ